MTRKERRFWEDWQRSMTRGEAISQDNEQVEHEEVQQAKRTGGRCHCVGIGRCYKHEHPGG